MLRRPLCTAARAAVAGLALAALQAWAQAPATTGTIALRVDATDLDRKILRVRQTMPVRPGPLKLQFPRWLPGTHAPTGDINQLAGLKITAGGQAVAWRRDPVDVYAFHVDVPAGARELALEFQQLSPTSRDSGRTIVTQQIVNVQWNSLVLYPAGVEARQLRVAPALVLPADWEAGTALRPAGKADGALQFQPVSLEMLVDSPVFAGRHFRRIELDPPGAPRPVVLNLVADSADKLDASESQIEAHRELVRQADKLFASRHYAQYDFLLAISDDLGGIGLEHHQSSENGVRANYWEHWNQRIGARELLPHEYAHSWNGKFRRPADLTTPDFNVPMQNSLLWQYEGQTQFWGWVLAARSGLVTLQQARDQLAGFAAYYDHQAGRAWRSLQDTTLDPIMTARRGSKDWSSWQRTGGDYYGESLLIWLDADSLIREKSGGTKSLDDYARAFFGVRDGELGPLTYRYEDIVATLQAVQPHDWAAFLRQRLDSNAASGPLDGITRGGWKLVYAETPNDTAKADEAADGYADFSYSLGLRVGNDRGQRGQADGRISSVMWGSHAYAAGLAPGVVVIAVNGRSYKAEGLRQAITANRGGQAPIELLVRDGDSYRTVRIDYRGGLRYPRLERGEGEDRLSALLGRR